MALRNARGRWSLLLIVFAACTGEQTGQGVDAGQDANVEFDGGIDLGESLDAQGADAFAADAAEDAASLADASMISGFGVIAGPCGRVAAEIDDPSPSYFATRLDFMTDGFDDPAERTLLTSGAQEILADGTAGGSSGVSEAFAFEVLARCENAEFVKSETEIIYDPVTSKKTDILVSIGGQRVGVSVTRAVGFPRTDPYTEANAAFIERKLTDILESSANVVAADHWEKQILLVMAYSDMHASAIQSVWESLSAETRADTILYIVVTDGDDEAIY